LPRRSPRSMASSTSMERGGAKCSMSGISGKE
jgi:hypothetical protein